MKIEMRRWFFGGTVGLFVLAALLAQLALEWRRSHDAEEAKRRQRQANLLPTPASAQDALGRAIEALEKTEGNDPVRLQRAQQRLLDEARKARPRYLEHFDQRLESIERVPPPRALVLAEAFFATASDENWATVARFLDRHDGEHETATCVALRAHFLDRMRRQPPGEKAWPALEPTLSRLVRDSSDLPTAHTAAEAYMALHRDRIGAAREHVRSLVGRRAEHERPVFADLLQ